MFSTVKSCKLLVFLGLALCLLLPGAPAFADTPMPPSQESSQCALVEPLGYTDDVVDTYLELQLSSRRKRAQHLDVQHLLQDDLLPKWLSPIRAS